MPQVDRVAEATAKILEAFRSGSLPRALAQTYIGMAEEAHAQKWSFRNRLLLALAGYSDARGFRQWKQVGRTVRKGEKAFYILRPQTLRREVETEEGTEEELCVIGFHPVAVFGYEQTEGEPIEGIDAALTFLDGSPLLQVARSLGVKVSPAIAGAGFLGSYSPSRDAIALACENLRVFAHELVHAADHRLHGPLKGGQHPDQEVVAEFGGATLLVCLGEEVQADLGSCFDYLQKSCCSGDQTPEEVALSLLDRIEKCVSFLLEQLEESAEKDRNEAA